MKLSRSERMSEVPCWKKLHKLHELQPKPEATDELKVALHSTWEVLPQERINKVIANFIN